MKKPSRVLVIGLDGATWDVLDPWMNDGTLPNLARLRQRGSWGVLRSSIPPITAAAWSTFMTGKRPGKHGVFHFIKLFDDIAPASDKPDLVDASSIKSPALWDVLGHYDRKVALINLPMTYPTRAVNGFMITGLLTPRNASIFTYPPELGGDLPDYTIDLDRFVDARPYQGILKAEDVAPSLALMHEFQEMLEKRIQASLSLMDSKPWDFYMVVFTGPDRMGHYLWPYHHPADVSDPEIRQLHHAVREYYVRLDEAVGSLVEKAGEDVVVILMSDHGMGPIYTRRAHWNNWLLAHGWLATETNNSGMSSPDRWLKRLGLPRDRVGRILLRIPGLAKSRFMRRATNSSAAAVDKKSSKAYCVPVYNTVFGIRINAEGEEKESLREEITRALEQVTDPETGQHIVQSVHRGEEYYHGPYAKNIPEILVVMNPDYAAGYRVSHYSSIATELQMSSNHGDHRMEGIFVASGPGIVSNAAALSGLNIEDVAPTVLYLMDLPVPSDMDGRVLTEALAPGVLESQAVRAGTPMGFWPEEEVVFSEGMMSEEDETQIRERLRALGYLD